MKSLAGGASTHANEAMEEREARDGRRGTFWLVS